MSEPDIYEDDGENIYVSTSASTSVSAFMVGPDDDGLTGVREPLNPLDSPPSLAAEAEPHRE